MRLMQSASLIVAAALSSTFAQAQDPTATVLRPMGGPPTQHAPNLAVELAAEIVKPTSGPSLCKVTAGDVNMGKPTNQKKKIVWAIKPKPEASGTFEFLPNGIRLLNVTAGSTSDDIEDGAQGAGPGTAPTNIAPKPEMMYHVHNKHRTAGEVAYLPLILHRDGGLPSLCAVIDPKIVNRAAEAAGGLPTR